MPLGLAARDELILEHAEWARRVALHTLRTMRIIMRPDDALAAGLEALVEVAGRYRPELGEFRSYAHRRIVGEILDQAYAASGAWRHDAGGARLYPPTPVSINTAKRVWLDDPGDSWEIARVWLSRHDDAAHDAEARIDLEPLLAELGEREREILRLSYVEDIPLAEIGKRLGMTESRACQIRQGAVAALRELAAGRGHRTTRRAK